MPKSIKVKQELARSMLEQGIPYSQIQEELRNQFGSGMSNSTLQKLALENNRIGELENQVQELTIELRMYKKLYYELLETLKEKI